MRKPLYFSTLANTGRYALVPPIVVGLLLPAVLLVIRAGTAPQIAPVYIEKCTTLLIPALAAWWPPFVFKERIEGDGRELLYFLKRNGEGVAALALGLSYLGLVVPFALAALGSQGFTASAILLLCARCVFVASLAFCAAYMLKSSALGLVLALLFNMTAMTPLEVWAGSLANTGADAAGVGASGVVVALYALLSAALLGAGEIRGRRFAG